MVIPPCDARSVILDNLFVTLLMSCLIHYKICATFRVLFNEEPRKKENNTYSLLHYAKENLVQSMVRWLYCAVNFLRKEITKMIVS